MSRVLNAAAIGAIGLFSFAASTRADAPAAASSPTTQATTIDNSAIVQKDDNSARPWRASQVIGIRVDNADGEHLGKIEDIVFNPTDGHIRYAVLSFGGFLGVGEKFFAIPWKHLRAEAKSGTVGNEKFVLVLDVDKSRLKNAPGFDSKNWPDFGNPAYGKSLDEYYGDTATAEHSTTSTK
jgi:sporulation protein YlmC with PRC-barrel domain